MTKINGLHLVFIHGWGMNQGIWQSFLQNCEHEWAGRVTLEAVDLPGFGTNHKVDLETYTIGSISEFVQNRLRPRSVIVGWSMGGLIAQYLTDIGDPNLIAQIQIASSPKFLQTDDWLGIRGEVLEEFNRQLGTDHLKLLKRFLSIQCLGLEQPKEKMRTMLNAISQFPLSNSKTLSKSLHLLSDTDLRPNSRKMQTNNLPTLRIFGELDSLIPKRAIPAIENLYPNDTVLLIPKASHAPFLSHPIQCFDMINAFLQPYIRQSSY